MIDLRSSPVSVSQQASKKMPRLLLLTLLFVFALSGLITRDVWSVREGMAFGEALEMSMRSGADWLFPFISGEVLTSHGPLSIWVSALLIKISGGAISAIAASRISFLLWFLLGTACLWYGTWFLARRREAQPIGQIFGEQASYRDFGRMVADSSVLFFLALFGLVMHAHEPTFESAELAFAIMAFFGCTWSLTRPYWGTALAGIACGCSILASTLLSGIVLLVAACLAQIFVKGIGRLERKLATTVVCAFLTFLIWPAIAFWLVPDMASDYFSLWSLTQADALGLADLSEVLWLIKHFVWYLCPAWPFAFWAVWVWRRHPEVTHIAMPLSFIGAWILGFVFADHVPAETLLTVIIAPVCLLASFGLMAARRSYKSLLDCFSLTVFTLALAGVWLYWLAWALGFPPKMARSVTNLAPVASAFDAGFWIVIALAVSGVWFAMVTSRLRHRPQPMWYGPWLSAVGMTVLWATVIMLLAPAIDNNRSYKPVAEAVRSAVTDFGYEKGTDCLQADTLHPGERAMISYYSGLDLSIAESQTCKFLLKAKNVNVLPETDEYLKVILTHRPREDKRFYIEKRTQN